MHKVVFGLAAIAIFSTIIAVSMASLAKSQEPQAGHDSVTVLLSNKKIPSGDFIHLYDSFPLRIVGGHIALKVNCDEDGKGIVSVVVGVAPDFEVIDLTTDNMVYEVFTQRKTCVYHMNLPPEGVEVVDIGLINIQDKSIRLASTATAVLHIHGVSEAISHEEHS
ncbi:MAG: hypothetical protein ACE5J2_01675 [Nitrososphaerales archaeon]